MAILRGGKPLGEAVSSVGEKLGVPAGEMPFVRNLVAGVLKNLRLLDYIILRLVKSGKYPSDIIAAALRVGGYQIIDGVIPDYAAVDTTVDAVKSFSVHPKEVALVNAVLRNFARRWRDIKLPADRQEYLSVKYSHPRWLVRMFLKQFGDEAEKLLEANNQVPPRTFRVNAARVPPRNLHNWLKDSGFEFEPGGFFEEYFSLKSRVSPAEFPPMNMGLVSVQDEAFAVPVYYLEPSPGEMILEVGAAPGGKTGHIAEMLGGKTRHFFALDISPSRCGVIVENFSRLKIFPPGIVAADFLRAPFRRRQFDKILIDAPCSSLGVIRRHPEIRWHRSPQDVKRLARLQKRLVAAAVPLLKKGGILVFTTCTLADEENLGVLRFAKRSSELVQLPPPDTIPPELIDVNTGAVLTLPHRHNLDGSFTVAFMRK